MSTTMTAIARVESALSVMYTPEFVSVTRKLPFLVKNQLVESYLMSPRCEPAMVISASEIPLRIKSLADIQKLADTISVCERLGRKVVTDVAIRTPDAARLLARCASTTTVDAWLMSRSTTEAARVVFAEHANVDTDLSARFRELVNTGGVVQSWRTVLRRNGAVPDLSSEALAAIRDGRAVPAAEEELAALAISICEFRSDSAVLQPPASGKRKRGASDDDDEEKNRVQKAMLTGMPTALSKTVVRAGRFTFEDFGVRHLIPKHGITWAGLGSLYNLARNRSISHSEWLLLYSVYWFHKSAASLLPPGESFRFSLSHASAVGIGGHGDYIESFSGVFRMLAMPALTGALARQLSLVVSSSGEHTMDTTGFDAGIPFTIEVLLLLIAMKSWRSVRAYLDLFLETECLLNHEGLRVALFELTEPEALCLKRELSDPVEGKLGIGYPLMDEKDAHRWMARYPHQPCWYLSVHAESFLEIAAENAVTDDLYFWYGREIQEEEEEKKGHKSGQPRQQRNAKVVTNRHTGKNITIHRDWPIRSVVVQTAIGSSAFRRMESWKLDDMRYYVIHAAVQWESPPPTAVYYEPEKGEMQDESADRAMDVLMASLKDTKAMERRAVERYNNKRKDVLTGTLSEVLADIVMLYSCDNEMLETGSHKWLAGVIRFREWESMLFWTPTPEGLNKIETEVGAADVVNFLSHAFVNAASITEWSRETGQLLEMYQHAKDRLGKLFRGIKLQPEFLVHSLDEPLEAILPVIGPDLVFPSDPSGIGPLSCFLVNSTGSCDSLFRLWEAFPLRKAWQWIEVVIGLVTIRDEDANVIRRVVSAHGAKPSRPLSTCINTLVAAGRASRDLRNLCAADDDSKWALARSDSISGMIEDANPGQDRSEARLVLELSLEDASSDFRIPMHLLEFFAVRARGGHLKRLIGEMEAHLIKTETEKDVLALKLSALRDGASASLPASEAKSLSGPEAGSLKRKAVPASAPARYWKKLFAGRKASKALGVMSANARTVRVGNFYFPDSGIREAISACGQSRAEFEAVDQAAYSPSVFEADLMRAMGGFFQSMSKAEHTGGSHELFSEFWFSGDRSRKVAVAYVGTDGGSKHRIEETPGVLVDDFPVTERAEVDSRLPFPSDVSVSGRNSGLMQQLLNAYRSPAYVADFTKEKPYFRYCVLMFLIAIQNWRSVRAYLDQWADSHNPLDDVKGARISLFQVRGKGSAVLRRELSIPPISSLETLYGLAIGYPLLSLEDAKHWFSAGMQPLWYLSVHAESLAMDAAQLTQTDDTFFNYLQNLYRRKSDPAGRGFSVYSAWFDKYVVVSDDQWPVYSVVVQTRIATTRTDIIPFPDMDTNEIRFVLANANILWAQRGPPEAVEFYYDRDSGDRQDPAADTLADVVIPQVDVSHSVPPAAIARWSKRRDAALEAAIGNILPDELVQIVSLYQCDLTMAPAVNEPAMPDLAERERKTKADAWLDGVVQFEQWGSLLQWKPTAEGLEMIKAGVVRRPASAVEFVAHALAIAASFPSDSNAWTPFLDTLFRMYKSAKAVLDESFNGIAIPDLRARSNALIDRILPEIGTDLTFRESPSGIEMPTDFFIGPGNSIRALARAWERRPEFAQWHCVEMFLDATRRGMEGVAELLISPKRSHGLIPGVLAVYIRTLIGLGSLNARIADWCDPTESGWDMSGDDRNAFYVVMRRGGFWPRDRLSQAMAEADLVLNLRLAHAPDGFRIPERALSFLAERNVYGYMDGRIADVREYLARTESKTDIDHKLALLAAKPLPELRYRSLLDPGAGPPRGGAQLEAMLARCSAADFKREVEDREMPGDLKEWLRSIYAEVADNIEPLVVRSKLPFVLRSVPPLPRLRELVRVCKAKRRLIAGDIAINTVQEAELLVSCASSEAIAGWLLLSRDEPARQVLAQAADAGRDLAQRLRNYVSTGLRSWKISIRRLPQAAHPETLRMVLLGDLTGCRELETATAIARMCGVPLRGGLEGPEAGSSRKRKLSGDDARQAEAKTEDGKEEKGMSDQGEEDKSAVSDSEEEEKGSSPDGDDDDEEFNNELISKLTADLAFSKGSLADILDNFTRKRDFSHAEKKRIAKAIMAISDLTRFSDNDTWMPGFVAEWALKVHRLPIRRLIGNKLFDAAMIAHGQVYDRGGFEYVYSGVDRAVELYYNQPERLWDLMAESEWNIGHPTRHSPFETLVLSEIAQFYRLYKDANNVNPSKTPWVRYDLSPRSVGYRTEMKSVGGMKISDPAFLYDLERDPEYISLVTTDDPFPLDVKIVSRYETPLERAQAQVKGKDRTGLEQVLALFRGHMDLPPKANLGYFIMSMVTGRWDVTKAYLNRFPETLGPGSRSGCIDRYWFYFVHGRGRGVLHPYLAMCSLEVPRYVRYPRLSLGEYFQWIKTDPACWWFESHLCEFDIDKVAAIVTIPHETGDPFEFSSREEHGRYVGPSSVYNPTHGVFIRIDARFPVFSVVAQTCLSLTKTLDYSSRIGGPLGSGLWAIRMAAFALAYAPMQAFLPDIDDDMINRVMHPVLATAEGVPQEVPQDVLNAFDSITIRYPMSDVKLKFGGTPLFALWEKSHRAVLAPHVLAEGITHLIGMYHHDFEIKKYGEAWFWDDVKFKNWDSIVSNSGFDQRLCEQMVKRCTASDVHDFAAFVLRDLPRAGSKWSSGFEFLAHMFLSTGNKDSRLPVISIERDLAWKFINLLGPFVTRPSGQLRHAIVDAINVGKDDHIDGFLEFIREHRSMEWLRVELVCRIIEQFTLGSGSPDREVLSSALETLCEDMTFGRPMSTILNTAHRAFGLDHEVFRSSVADSSHWKFKRDKLVTADGSGRLVTVSVDNESALAQFELVVNMNIRKYDYREFPIEQLRFVASRNPDHAMDSMIIALGVRIVTHHLRRQGIFSKETEIEIAEGKLEALGIEASTRKSIFGYADPAAKTGDKEVKSPETEEAKSLGTEEVKSPETGSPLDTEMLTAPSAGPPSAPALSGLSLDLQQHADQLAVFEGRVVDVTRQYPTPFVLYRLPQGETLSAVFKQCKAARRALEGPMIGEISDPAVAELLAQQATTRAANDWLLASTNDACRETFAAKCDPYADIHARAAAHWQNPTSVVLARLTQALPVVSDSTRQCLLSGDLTACRQLPEVEHVAHILESNGLMRSLLARPDWVPAAATLACGGAWMDDQVAEAIAIRAGSMAAPAAAPPLLETIWKTSRSSLADGVSTTSILSPLERALCGALSSFYDRTGQATASTHVWKHQASKFPFTTVDASACLALFRDASHVYEPHMNDPASTSVLLFLVAMNSPESVRTYLRAHPVVPGWVRQLLAELLPYPAWTDTIRPCLVVPSADPESVFFPDLTLSEYEAWLHSNKCPYWYAAPQASEFLATAAALAGHTCAGMPVPEFDTYSGPMTVWNIPFQKYITIDADAPVFSVFTQLCSSVGFQGFSAALTPRQQRYFITHSPFVFGMKINSIADILQTPGDDASLVDRLVYCPFSGLDPAEPVVKLAFRQWQDRNGKDIPSFETDFTTRQPAHTVAEAVASGDFGQIVSRGLGHHDLLRMQTQSPPAKFLDFCEAVFRAHPWTTAWEDTFECVAAMYLQACYPERMFELRRAYSHAGEFSADRLCQVLDAVGDRILCHNKSEHDLPVFARNSIGMICVSGGSKCISAVVGYIASHPERKWTIPGIVNSLVSCNVHGQGIAELLTLYGLPLPQTFMAALLIRGAGRQPAVYELMSSTALISAEEAECALSLRALPADPAIALLDFIATLNNDGSLDHDVHLLDSQLRDNGKIQNLHHKLHVLHRYSTDVDVPRSGSEPSITAQRAVLRADPLRAIVEVNKTMGAKLFPSAIVRQMCAVCELDRDAAVVCKEWLQREGGHRLGGRAGASVSADRHHFSPTIENLLLTESPSVEHVLMEHSHSPVTLSDFWACYWKPETRKLCSQVVNSAAHSSDQFQSILHAAILVGAATEDIKIPPSRDVGMEQTAMLCMEMRSDHVLTQLHNFWIDLSDRNSWLLIDQQQRDWSSAPTVLKHVLDRLDERSAIRLATHVFPFTTAWATRDRRRIMKYVQWPLVVTDPVAFATFEDRKWAMQNMCLSATLAQVLRPWSGDLLLLGGQVQHRSGRRFRVPEQGSAIAACLQLLNPEHAAVVACVNDAKNAAAFLSIATTAPLQVPVNLQQSEAACVELIRLRSDVSRLSRQRVEELRQRQASLPLADTTVFHTGVRMPGYRKLGASGAAATAAAANDNDSKFFWDNLTRVRSVDHLPASFRHEALSLLLKDHFERRQPLVVSEFHESLLGDLPPVECFSARMAPNDARAAIYELVLSLESWQLATAALAEIDPDFLVLAGLDLGLHDHMASIGLKRDAITSFRVLNLFDRATGRELSALQKAWPDLITDVSNVAAAAAALVEGGDALGVVADGARLARIRAKTIHRALVPVPVPSSDSTPVAARLLGGRDASVTLSAEKMADFASLTDVISPERYEPVSAHALLDLAASGHDSFSGSWQERAFLSTLDAGLQSTCWARAGVLPSQDLLMHVCHSRHAVASLFSRDITLQHIPPLLKLERVFPHQGLTEFETGLLSGSIQTCMQIIDECDTEQERDQLVLQLIALNANHSNLDTVMFGNLETVPVPPKDAFLFELLCEAAASSSTGSSERETDGMVRMPFRDYSVSISVPLLRRFGFRGRSSGRGRPWPADLVFRIETIDAAAWPSILDRFGLPSDPVIIARLRQCTDMVRAVPYSPDDLDWLVENNMAEDISEVQNQMESGATCSLYACWLADVTRVPILGGPMWQVERMKGGSPSFSDRALWNQFCARSGHPELRRSLYQRNTAMFVTSSMTMQQFTESVLGDSLRSVVVRPEQYAELIKRACESWEEADVFGAMLAYADGALTMQELKRRASIICCYEPFKTRGRNLDKSSQGATARTCVHSLSF